MKTTKTTIKVTFTFAEDYDYETSEKFAKKINRFVYNSYIPVTAGIFNSRYEIEAILTFDNARTDASDWKVVERKLNTMIESHKQPAMWGYASREITKVVA